MTKYMMLFRGGDAHMAKMSPEEIEAHMGKWGAWIQDMTEKGQMVEGDPLENRTGKVVSGQAKVISDGPFMEGKELVGGFLIVNASSLEEATEISKGCPIFESQDGSVEVREIIAVDL